MGLIVNFTEKEVGLTLLESNQTVQLMTILFSLYMLYTILTVMDETKIVVSDKGKGALNIV